MRIGSTSGSTAVSVAAPPGGPTNKSAAAINPHDSCNTFWLMIASIPNS